MTLRNTFWWLKSVPITTKVMSSNPVDGEVYSIQHYVIRFDSDLWQVGDFFRVLRFPPPINLTAKIELKYSRVAINTINQPTTWWLSWHVMFMTFWFSSSQRLLNYFAFPVFWHTALIIANSNNNVKNYINLDFN